MVEVFTKQQFEDALPSDDKTGKRLWICVGMQHGEWMYSVPVVGTNKFVMIRSTVLSDGSSAGTGKDSIRMWVEYEWQGKRHPIGKANWTTRESGWQQRMLEKIRTLYALGLADSKQYYRSIGRDFNPKVPNGIRSPILSPDKRTPVEVERVPVVPKCPNCGSDMVIRHRRSDDHKFWGCPQYPKCKGARDYVDRTSEVSVASTRKPTEFKPNKYQLAIFDEIANGTGHVVIEGVAGCGKTTTIVKGLELTSSDAVVGFFAFNKKIAKELASRAPEWTKVGTLSSLGYRNVRHTYPNVEFNQYKVKDIVDELAKSYGLALQDKIATLRSSVTKLVTLCKAHMLQPTVENIMWIADRHNIELNESADFAVELTAKAFRKSVEQIPVVVDYADMVYACAIGLASCQQFDYMFIDECQDLNRMQTVMIQKSVSQRHGRVIAVGDRYQAIYGFRGADTDAIPNLISMLNAKTMPLSITYRCPLSHVKMAQQLVPHIEAAPWAEDGVINNISKAQFEAVVETHDLVMCRCNAPLVGPAFSLIRQGKKAVVLGRDIGEGLIALIRRIQDKYKVNELKPMLVELAQYVKSEVAKLTELNRAGMAQTLQDKYETILALSDGCEGVDDVLHRIDKVFSDEADGVVFSSVHRAKGLEAERTYIIEPKLMPHPYASRDWELVQEYNIKYVALTRSKREMTFVY